FASRHFWIVSARAATGAPDGRRRARVVAGGLVAVAVAAELANVLVLPRLYSWFHAAAAALTFAAAMLAARLFLRARRPPAAPPASRRRSPVVAAGAFALAVAAVVAGFQVRRSQTIRFAALERTAATAQL